MTLTEGLATGIRTMAANRIAVGRGPLAERLQKVEEGREDVEMVRKSPQSTIRDHETIPGKPLRYQSVMDQSSSLILIWLLQPT